MDAKKGADVFSFILTTFYEVVKFEFTGSCSFLSLCNTTLLFTNWSRMLTGRHNYANLAIIHSKFVLTVKRIVNLQSIGLTHYTMPVSISQKFWAGSDFLTLDGTFFCHGGLFKQTLKILDRKSKY